MFTIEIRDVTLSDGSKVYNVELRHHTLDCVTAKDAYALANGLEALILAHTNENCRVISR